MPQTISRPAPPCRRPQAPARPPLPQRHPSRGRTIRPSSARAIRELPSACGGYAVATFGAERSDARVLRPSSARDFGRRGVPDAHTMMVDRSREVYGWLEELRGAGATVGPDVLQALSRLSDGDATHIVRNALTSCQHEWYDLGTVLLAATRGGDDSGEGGDGATNLCSARSRSSSKGVGSSGHARRHGSPCNNFNRGTSSRGGKKVGIMEAPQVHTLLLSAREKQRQRLRHEDPATAATMSEITEMADWGSRIEAAAADSASAFRCTSLACAQQSLGINTASPEKHAPHPLDSLMVMGFGDAVCTRRAAANSFPTAENDILDAKPLEALRPSVDRRCWEYLERRHPRLLGGRSDRRAEPTGTVGSLACSLVAVEDSLVAFGCHSPSSSPASCGTLLAPLLGAEPTPDERRARDLISARFAPFFRKRAAVAQTVLLATPTVEEAAE